jgi:hypothetical protein
MLTDVWGGEALSSGEASGILTLIIVSFIANRRRAAPPRNQRQTSVCTIL